MVPYPIHTQLRFQTADQSPLGRVRLAGFVRNSAGIGQDTMRTFGSYAFVYLLEGKGRFSDARGTDCPVTAGDLMVVFPDIAHCYGPVGDLDWTEFYIVFDGPVFDLWRTRGLLEPAEPVWHLEPIAYWRAAMEQVVAEGLPVSMLERVGRLQCLQSEMVAAQRGARPGEETQWLRRAQQLLQEGVPRNCADLEQVAAALDMSYEGFRKRFARLAGMPPARYRNQLLIDEACRLMQGRQMSIKRVARACGFCDEFHFSRSFKRVVGVTPSDFRRRLST
ncbi:MAG: AraC family transcriptional regulator [Phycisphaerae bacterium]